ncbi:hypothetical protein ACHWQZ_G008960 [Mnemiopsis leidyi]
MGSVEKNRDIVSYYCTKHSWRGKYKRVFTVGTHALSTYNPGSSEQTNIWSYSDVFSIVPSPKSNNEFKLFVRKNPGKPQQTDVTFSCEYRLELLTYALKYFPKFAGNQTVEFPRYRCVMIDYTDHRVEVNLILTPCSLEEYTVSGKLLNSYNYKDIQSVARVQDYPGGFVIIYGNTGRMVLFGTNQLDDLLKNIEKEAVKGMAIVINTNKKVISQSDFMEGRWGNFSDDQSQTSLSEFNVNLLSTFGESTTRILCLSESCVLERDPNTYNVCTMQPLTDIWALIRHAEDPQMFTIEYNSMSKSTYTCQDRDALLASILDGARGNKNRDICVQAMKTNMGARIGPLYLPVEEEVESICLKLLAEVGTKKDTTQTLGEATRFFNTNVSYSGLAHAVTEERLFAENKERLISNALGALVTADCSTVKDTEANFHAMRRLVASRAGFAAFTNLSGFREKLGLKVIKSFKFDDDGVSHAAVDLIATLMQPMHDNYNLRQEQLNKSSLLSTKAFLEKLVDLLKCHVMRGTGALVINALLDFFSYALCVPYSETTDSAHFDMLLEMLAGLGRCLFKLFLHPSLSINKGAGLLMKAIIEEGSPETAFKMQELALAEGALLRHLRTGLVTPATDSRQVMMRQLSRHLLGLWTSAHKTSLSLLRRIFPIGLLNFLESDEEITEEERDMLNTRDNLKLVQTLQKSQKFAINVQYLENALMHWKTRVGMEKEPPKEDDKPVILRRRREQIKITLNWKLFYARFYNDHATAALIWNYKTREELKEALDAELRAFNVDKELGGKHDISWNHTEFEVHYDSLLSEVKIGDYYLRLLLEEDDKVSKIHKPYEFFNDIYHRFLLTTTVQMRCMCLQAMAVVYRRYYEEIGTFNDTRYLVHMLDKCSDRQERDRTLQFMHSLLKHKKNVKLLLDAGGIKILIDLVSLAHLHTSRATTPFQSMFIEAGGAVHEEREWYYGNKEKERLGPYSLREIGEFWEEGVLSERTKCWAQGLDGWKPLRSIAQLKWTLPCSTGVALLNGTELSILILNMLIDICSFYPSREEDGGIIRPIPRAKRILSENCLPHLVQLLLTFEPVIVEKVAILLDNIMADNPVLPRLYQTGVFYFILMYTGSNVKPIATFLQNTHLRQAFRQGDSADTAANSILAPLLPSAMIYFLENHGPAKFSEIYLGEFDTPEAIWMSEMRRTMIQKIALHLGDFKPRLMCNTRALYQYMPIPTIGYEPLERELFCSIYYLRNLCNENKFPDWKIDQPVKLLKDCLEAWKLEVEKKGTDISIEGALETLGLQMNGEYLPEEKFIRKAYFKLANKYHPDKNPDGREIFESVNKAYEFLCSKNKQFQSGPSPIHINLILRTQSILFKRYGDVLQPYKYAGYPMLIKTIVAETNDHQLFSNEHTVLPSACELCFFTIANSALNAEELRRDNGLEALAAALDRCVINIGMLTKPTDMETKVCTFIVRCFSESAAFESAREKIQEMVPIIADICRLMQYSHLPDLVDACIDATSNFAQDYWLQTQLLQAGVLWSVLPHLFNYDYTLEEGGVEVSEATNTQAMSNRVAKQAIYSLARLGGYMGDTPENPAVRQVVHSLLTPYIATLMLEPDPKLILKLLNSNVQTPYFLWDGSTRGELLKYLEDQVESRIRSGVTPDTSYGSDFVFSAHKEELILGNVFVRIYNEQPSFSLKEPRKFCVDLLSFLGDQAQYLHSLLAMSNGDTVTEVKPEQQVRMKHSHMSLEALKHCMQHNPGNENTCCGYFKLLFALLKMKNEEIQHLALEVLVLVTRNQDCVNSIAEAKVMGCLLVMLMLLPSSRSSVLQVLHALVSNTTIIKEVLIKGSLIYLLHLFCNSSAPTIREDTALLFSKMLSDKLVGPKVRLVLLKFLPSLFVEALSDSCETSIHMFDNNHENPELVWSDESREKLCGTVQKMMTLHFKEQLKNQDVDWRLPTEFNVKYTDMAGELVVGGVFLRHFIKQPSWGVRKPRDFMSALFDAVLQHQNGGDNAETISTALIALLTSQPILAEQVPPLGHIPKIMQLIAAKPLECGRLGLQILVPLADNDSCVKTFCNTSTSISSIMVAMKNGHEAVAVGAEVCHKAFTKNQPGLVAQALQSDLVPYLLSLLEDVVHTPASAKAQVVIALKAMQMDVMNGGKVLEKLQNSPIWASYKDQKHDLFLETTRTAGYLTGPVGAAGYLTAGPANIIPDTPPPLNFSVNEGRRNRPDAL